MIANKNTRVLVMCLLIAGTMGAVAYAAVPFYTLFCKATGFLGTTQRVDTASVKTTEQFVTVTFDTNVDQNLPWDFAPDVHSIKAKLGENYTVTFHAHNHSDKTVAGMATFNVQPDKAGSYFNKVQCFCFDKQVLKPDETASMAVQFYVDPEMANDKYTNDITNLTLSYTFFLAKDQADPQAKVRISEPSTAKPKNTGNPT